MLVTLLFVVLSVFPIIDVGQFVALFPQNRGSGIGSESSWLDDLSRRSAEEKSRDRLIEVMNSLCPETQHLSFVRESDSNPQ